MVLAAATVALEVMVVAGTNTLLRGRTNLKVRGAFLLCQKTRLLPRLWSLNSTCYSLRVAWTSIAEL